MKDFIFIIGPSGVGKSTLAKKLFKYYNSVYIEQYMIPEFGIPENVDVGRFEDEILFKRMIREIKGFKKLGFKNIIALDFNDVRTREIPNIFRGYDFITLKLICSDYKQQFEQMTNRGKGLKTSYERLVESSQRIINRKLLPNEVIIDVANKSSKQVYEEAKKCIKRHKSEKEYSYRLMNKKNFGTWVKSDKK